MDDLEWLDEHWWYYYANHGQVGEYFCEQMGNLAVKKTARGIIEEMRLYQTRNTKAEL